MLFSSRSLVSVGLLLISLFAVLKAGDIWTNKPAAQWSEEDARQLLASSPWSTDVTGVVTRRLTEEQLREGGRMGQPLGVGNEGVDPQGSGPTVSFNVLTGPGGDDRSLRSRSRPIKLHLRWESALPVQIAELKSHEVSPPTLDTDGYRLAVYGIPGSHLSGDPSRLGEPLKGMATLKRVGKRDVKPSSVEVFARESDFVVVYRFPSSAEIIKGDHKVRFDAQIGRVVLSQEFNLEEMTFLGKFEI